MRGLLSFAFLLLLSVLGVSAQSSPATSTNELSTCALFCLGAAIENSPCEVGDQKCICTNAPLQVEATACVIATCTVKQALTTQNITSVSCNAPIRNKGGAYNVLSITLGVISAIVVLLRFGSKFVTRSTFGLDDYSIGVTLLVGIPNSILASVGLIQNGLGQDIWKVPFDTIYEFAYALYVMEVIYFALVALLKMSLLFFYLRIFPASRLRQLIWGTITFNAIFGIVFVFVGIFQCKPISHYWRHWDGEDKGTCVNVNALAWANAAISIALDVWMIALPMSQVVKLNLHWKKKVGVGMMFGVGTFVTIVSILRLQSLAQFANSLNPTWDNFAVSQWSTIEINVGVMCACMPSMRLLLVHYFPKVLGTSHPSNTGYQVHSSSGRMGNSQISRSNHISHNISSPVNPKKNEILYSQSYAVDNGRPWEQDESHLELSDLDVVPLKANNRTQ